MVQFKIYYNYSGNNSNHPTTIIARKQGALSGIVASCNNSIFICFIAVLLQTFDAHNYLKITENLILPLNERIEND